MKLVETIASRRSKTGSMLALTMALSIAIVLVIAYFIFEITRILGSHQEQNTAIEAAALAGASAIGKLVVEDPNLGFIALADQAPSGTATKAGDGFATPVIGINTWLATNRLDMILSDLLDDQTMRDLSAQDYASIMAAKDTLTAEIKRCCHQGAAGIDLNGKPVKPWEEAEAAYLQNKVRMTGDTALKSFKLSVGIIPELVTNVPVPQPNRFAQMQANQQLNGCYLAYVDIPYNQKSFVFAATTDKPSLVDHKKFKDGPSSVPYFIPTVIRCESEHELRQRDTHGNVTRRVVYNAACAQPGAPLATGEFGALVVTFPKGAISLAPSLYGILTESTIAKPPVDKVETVASGDFPSNPLSPARLRVFNSSNPPFGQILRFAFYDWLRRGRATVNVQSLLASLNQPFGRSTAPHSNWFTFEQNGDVLVTERTDFPIAPLPVSHKQYRAITGIAVIVDAQKYDVFVKDYVSQPGRTNGGIHAGEPLPVVPYQTAPVIGPQPTMDDNPADIQPPFPLNTSTNIGRPTYTNEGVAVEIRFRPR